VPAQDGRSQNRATRYSDFMSRQAHSNLLSAVILALLSCCQSQVPARTDPAQAAPTPQHPNLIGNGDFSHGSTPWGAKALMAGGTERELEVRLRDGALCASLPGQGELILGWPTTAGSDQFSLATGRSYQLSLRASTTRAGLDCVAKVGHQLPPYTAALGAPMHLTASFQPFQFPFVADHDDERAGIAIECRAPPDTSETDVCIDDVVFVQL
jgi:hypothetical protein